MHNKNNNKTKTFIQGLRPFSSSIPKTLRKHLKKGGYNFSNIVDNWTKIVSEKISDACYPITVKMGKEMKDGVFGLLSLGDSVWKEIELNPENEEKWLEVSVLADMAANYSTIYNVWCKDMINHRMKMRMMSEKKKGKKEKEDN